ncbi:MAG: helix-turn-helix transcriptional regulator [Tepidisphaeraceae bacterium]|jgi:DNA-binding NarL/FixJ family response regulator
MSSLADSLPVFGLVFLWRGVAFGFGTTMNRRPKETVSRTKADSHLIPCEWKGLVRALDMSGRQAEIIELILQGKKDKQIAMEMGLSKHTVRTYLNRIFARMEVTDRLGLVLRVFAEYRESCTHSTCPYKV